MRTIGDIESNNKDEGGEKIYIIAKLIMSKGGIRGFGWVVFCGWQIRVLERLLPT